MEGGHFLHRIGPQECLKGEGELWKKSVRIAEKNVLFFVRFVCCFGTDLSFLFATASRAFSLRICGSDSSCRHQNAPAIILLEAIALATRTT